MRRELFDGAGVEDAGASYPTSLASEGLSIQNFDSKILLFSTSVTNSPVLVGGEGFEDPAFQGLKDFEVEFLRAKRRIPVARFLTSRNLKV